MSLARGMPRKARAGRRPQGAMTTAVIPLRNLPPSFQHYRVENSYDEMFEAPGLPRAPYQALYQTLLPLPPGELRRSQQAPDPSLLPEGITFAVYRNKGGTQRLIP